MASSSCRAWPTSSTASGSISICASVCAPSSVCAASVPDSFTAASCAALPRWLFSEADDLTWHGRPSGWPWRSGSLQGGGHGVRRCHFTSDLLARQFGGHAQVIGGLLVHPVLRRGAEITCQAQGRIRADAATLTHEVVDAGGGHMQANGQAAGRQT